MKKKIKVEEIPFIHRPDKFSFDMGLIVIPIIRKIPKRKRAK